MKAATTIVRFGRTQLVATRSGHIFTRVLPDSKALLKPSPGKKAPASPHNARRKRSSTLSPGGGAKQIPTTPKKFTTANATKIKANPAPVKIQPALADALRWMVRTHGRRPEHQRAINLHMLAEICVSAPKAISPSHSP
ncbi:unnamed protein product [Cutaneotrichosporon oleaginosum]